MNTRDKVDWSTTPVRVNLTHKIQGYENHDKIEIPIIYTCTDEGKRVYDREVMMNYLEDVIINIIEHEKKYY